MWAVVMAVVAMLAAAASSKAEVPTDGRAESGHAGSVQVEAARVGHRVT